MSILEIILLSSLGLALLIYIVVTIVKTIRKKKNKTEDDD